MQSHCSSIAIYYSGKVEDGLFEILKLSIPRFPAEMGKEEFEIMDRGESLRKINSSFALLNCVKPRKEVALCTHSKIPQTKNIKFE